jgi:uncharacterized SAM-binding protein YcdF (DUF218 family)
MEEGSSRVGRVTALGCLGTGVALILAVAGLYAFRIPLLRLMADSLAVEESLRPADLIYVLNGEVNSRPFRAADLYHRGYAPKVVVPRAEALPAELLGVLPTTTEVTVAILRRLGVPEEAVVVLEWGHGVTSTREEGQALRRYLETSGGHRVIVVTSTLHGRRARWILHRELAGARVEVMMARAPHIDFDRDRWWRSEEGLKYVFNEWVKLAFYHLAYRGEPGRDGGGRDDGA